MHTFTDFWRKSDPTLPIVPYQCLDLCLPLVSKGTPFPRLEAWQEINFSSPHPQLCKDYWWPPTPAHSTIPITSVCAATFCALFSASFQLLPFICLCSAAVFGQTGKPIMKASCLISAGEEAAAADVYFHTFKTISSILKI